MGFVMPHITVLIGAGAVGLALLLEIVGLATPGWVVISVLDYGQGLWKVCQGATCVEYPSAPDWLDACRAFGILAVLAMGASLGCALLICFMSEQKIFTILAPAAAAAGALFAMIEFAIWAGEGSDASDNFGYSFALTVVACVLSVVAAIVFFIARNRGTA